VWADAAGGQRHPRGSSEQRGLLLRDVLVTGVHPLLTRAQTRRLIARARSVSLATERTEVQYLLATTTDQLECLNDLREREHRRVMGQEETAA
jgi:hypothetical protein